MVKWNSVTWYSKLGAIILFLGVIPALCFYIGTQYELTKNSLSSVIQTHTDACDVRNVDFSNRTVYLSQGGGYALPLHNGTYILNDDIAAPDWEYTIDSSSMSGNTRIIHIYAYHLSGSGSWDIALGYACINGQIKKVSEQDKLLSQ